MKLGIGLPNTMAHETDRTLMLDWARLADEAGFAVLGTIDKPNSTPGTRSRRSPALQGSPSGSGWRRRSSCFPRATRWSSQSRRR